MKLTKKLLTLALAALMLLSLAVPAMAANSVYTVLGDFVIYNDANNDGWLSGYNGPGGDVVIPDGVTRVALAFSENTTVTSVTFPSSVTFIQPGAFRGCTGLTSFTIPSGITSLYNFFNECSGLKSVTIPASVTEIVWNSFSGCTSLTDIYFGGTQEQWEKMEKDYIDLASTWVIDLEFHGGITLFPTGVNPTIHYNSTGPSGSTTPEPTPTTPEPTPTTPEPTPTTPSFGDVPADAWYAKPVAWAVEKGITNGTSKDTFSPEKTCNNAEILTFLWRACDKPSAPAANLSDVDSGVWYADAANWAKSKGMISGNKLSPDTPCTRASTVMFIWQAMGKPAASKTASFSDVPADSDYAAAVAWAVEKGVTNGTGNGTFSPDDICTRGHIVTFLQRAYA